MGRAFGPRHSVTGDVTRKRLWKMSKLQAAAFQAALRTAAILAAAGRISPRRMGLFTSPAAYAAGAAPARTRRWEAIPGAVGWPRAAA